MEKKQALTAEEQLDLMRQGYKVALELKVGALTVPCRLLPANEEAAAIATAKRDLKVPSEEMRPQFEGLEIQRAILKAATTVDGTPFLSQRFLEAASAVELEVLYDQYVTKVREASPEFETLTIQQINEYVLAVKKKERTSRSFFTWEHAAIGRYFLEVILPAVSEPGSS
jgi:hypothetical protein